MYTKKKKFSETWLKMGFQLVLNTEFTLGLWQVLGLCFIQIHKRFSKRHGVSNELKALTRLGSEPVLSAFWISNTVNWAIQGTYFPIIIVEDKLIRYIKSDLYKYIWDWIVRKFRFLKLWLETIWNNDNGNTFAWKPLTPLKIL